MTACHMCQDSEGVLPHAGRDGGPLGLACPRCHRIIQLLGEDPAAIDLDRAITKLRTMMQNNLRADMRLAIRRWRED